MLLLCCWVVPSQIPIIISIIIIIVVLVVVHKAVARVWASALIYVERTAAAAMKERVWSEPPRNINDQGHYGSAANMQRMNVIARQFFIVEHETRLCQRGLPRERTPHSWKAPPEVKEYFWKMTVPPLFGPEYERVVWVFYWVVRSDIESVYFVAGHSPPSEFFATDQTRDQFVQAMVWTQEDLCNLGESWIFWGMTNYILPRSTLTHFTLRVPDPHHRSSSIDWCCRKCLHWSVLKELRK